MQLFTSHWRNRELAHVDATIIGVSRGTPRRSPGFPYRVLRLLAPNDHAWAQQERDGFERAYLAQLEELGPEHILQRLAALSGGKAVIALCWEKLADPSEWCHREILARYLRTEAGIEVRELAPGDLPHRPDSPQPRLF